MRERDKFIDSIYELAERLGGEAVREDVDPVLLSRLTALGLQSCLGAVATILEESAPKHPSGPPVGTPVEDS